MKTVLITGGATGIGRETAKVFAQSGYRVVVQYNRSEKAAKELQKELQEQQNEVHLLQGDFSTLESVKSFTEKLLVNFPKIDVLINNAGVAFTGLLGDTTDERLQELFSVNVLGAMAVSREVLRGMIAQKSGVIINVSSVWGMVGASCEVAYSASKGALISFTKALAKEVAPCNIRVNCVAPGAVKTNMMREYTNDEIAQLKQEIPVGRLGAPEEIADTILFLASEKANYITGQVLSPNGGLVV